MTHDDAKPQPPFRGYAWDEERPTFEKHHDSTPPVHGLTPSGSWIDEAPRSLDDLLRADIERDAGLPPQHTKPGRVAKIAVGIIIAVLTFGVIMTIRNVTDGSRNDFTVVRPDPAKCEELVFGHTELILTQASSSADFNSRLSSAGTASQLYPECRGLTREQAKSVTDRVTSRLAPLIMARALEWSQQTS